MIRTPPAGYYPEEPSKEFKFNVHEADKIGGITFSLYIWENHMRNCLSGLTFTEGNGKLLVSL